MGMSTISVNGMTVEIRGRQVYVNGLRYVPEGSSSDGADVVELEHKVTIDRDGTIQGPIYGDLTVVGANVRLVVQGDVQGSVHMESGEVRCGDVGGSINNQGSVTCGDVGGSVNGTSVTCEDIGGSVNAGRVSRR